MIVPQRNIGVGSVVVAVRNGGYDSHGLPIIRPVKGKLYRVSGVYSMGYGLGCTLVDMDPYPYKGYFLFVKSTAVGRYPGAAAGWYFDLVREADEEFIELMRSISARSQRM